MESSLEYDNRRKSSCATIVPPTHSKFNARKASLIPFKINTAGSSRNLFYDTGSMAEISPTTIVSYREQLQKNKQEPEKTWIQRVKQKLSPQKPSKSANNEDCFKKTHVSEKQHQYNIQSSRVVRHSYSDPRLSPGSTAVGDDDEEEQQGYFSAIPKKKTKRTPRSWIAALLMILFGALIAVTFVLVGLGKALSNSSSNVASMQKNSTTVATARTTATSEKSVPSLEVSSLSVQTVTMVHKVIKPTASSF